MNNTKIPEWCLKNKKREEVHWLFEQHQSTGSGSEIVDKNYKIQKVQ